MEAHERQKCERERTIQTKRYGWAEARFFLAVLAGSITSLIFDNKFPLSITPSPITAEIYERAWQTGEISTRIFQTQGDSYPFPFCSSSKSLPISVYSIFLHSIPFSLLMFRHGRQQEIWHLVSHKCGGPSYHENRAAISFYMYRHTQPIVTVYKTCKSLTPYQTQNRGTSLVWQKLRHHYFWLIAYSLIIRHFLTDSSIQSKQLTLQSEKNFVLLNRIIHFQAPKNCCF